MLNKPLAIIPARGGSKRIPGKNIKDFLGQPIIAYSIQTALASGLFSEVMVSTDDEKIASVAQAYGASVPFFRSKKNANDYATTVDVLLEVLNEYEKKHKAFEYACCIYPTAPFTQAELLKKAFQLLIDKQADCVFPALPFSFPIQRAIKLDAAGKLSLFQPEHLNTRSQDLEKAFHDSGQFYWFNVENLQKKQALWTDNTYPIQISEMEAQDIDNPEDWVIAEFKYKLFTNGKK
ncbi:MAG: pseudaminic acid cytidylyltransferase [Saprospiraceae bacterium]